MTEFPDFNAACERAQVALDAFMAGENVAEALAKYEAELSETDKAAA